jgi:hypothetical protein
MGLAGPQGIRPQRSENQKAMIIQGRPLTNYEYPKRASASLRFFIRSRPGQLITDLRVPAGGLAVARFQFVRPARTGCFAADS